MWMVLAGCVLAVALVFSMLGQGGGALYTPLQVWLGVDFHQAATTSLFLIIVTSASASLVFHKARKIDWPLAIVLETVTAAGGFAGGLGSDWFSGATLSLVFAAVIGAAALFMVRPMKERRPSADRAGGALSWKRTLGEQTYLREPGPCPAAVLCGGRPQRAGGRRRRADQGAHDGAGPGYPHGHRRRVQRPDGRPYGQRRLCRAPFERTLGLADLAGPGRGRLRRRRR